MAWNGYVLEFLGNDLGKYYLGISNIDAKQQDELMLAALRAGGPALPVEIQTAYKQMAEKEVLLFTHVPFNAEYAVVEAWQNDHIHAQSLKARRFRFPSHRQETLFQCINAEQIVSKIKQLRSRVTVQAGIRFDGFYHPQLMMTDQQWVQELEMLNQLQSLYYYLGDFIEFFDEEFKEFKGTESVKALPYRNPYFINLGLQLSQMC